MSVPHTVVFDAVGTLIYAEPEPSVVYADLAREFGCQVESQVVRKRLGRALARPRKIRTSNYQEQLSWSRVVAEVFPELPDAEPLFGELWRHFADPSAWRCYEDVATCFELLTAAGYRCAVASNFDARLHAIARERLPLPAECPVFTSGDLGWSKPNPRFFQAVERRLRAAPRDLISIGDRRSFDVEPALNRGWFACEVQRDLHPLALQQVIVRLLDAIEDDPGGYVIEYRDPRGDSQ